MNTNFYFNRFMVLKVNGPNFFFNEGFWLYRYLGWGVNYVYHDYNKSRVFAFYTGIKKNPEINTFAYYYYTEKHNKFLPIRFKLYSFLLSNSFKYMNRISDRNLSEGLKIIKFDNFSSDFFRYFDTMNLKLRSSHRNFPFMGERYIDFDYFFSSYNGHLFVRFPIIDNNIFKIYFGNSIVTSSFNFFRNSVLINAFDELFPAWGEKFLLYKDFVVSKYRFHSFIFNNFYRSFIIRSNVFLNSFLKLFNFNIYNNLLFKFCVFFFSFFPLSFFKNSNYNLLSFNFYSRKSRIKLLVRRFKISPRYRIRFCKFFNFSLMKIRKRMRFSLKWWRYKTPNFLREKVMKVRRYRKRLKSIYRIFFFNILSFYKLFFFRFFFSDSLVSDESIMYPTGLLASSKEKDIFYIYDYIRYFYFYKLFRIFKRKRILRTTNKRILNFFRIKYKKFRYSKKINIPNLLKKGSLSFNKSKKRRSWRKIFTEMKKFK